MKKLIVTLALLIALYIASMPYILVTIDDGIAGISTRTSEHYKFETLAVWRW